MLNKAQMLELEHLALSLMDQGLTDDEIQAAVDARRADMIAEGNIDSQEVQIGVGAENQLREVEVVGERYPKAKKELEVTYAPQEEIVEEEIVEEGPKTQSQEWLEKQQKDLLDYEDNLIPQSDELFSINWAEDNQVYVPSTGPTAGVYIDPVDEGRTEAVEEAKKLLNEQNGGTNYNLVG